MVWILEVQKEFTFNQHTLKSDFLNNRYLNGPSNVFTLEQNAFYLCLAKLQIQHTIC